MELSKFGRDSLGRGYRIAFSNGDKEGRAWFMDLMKKAALETSIDAAGNIIGKRKGKNASLPAIAFGSHLDMVPDGGNYDGCVGSIGALEIMELLNEHHIVTEHPLELFIFTNEEGGTVGSSAMAGQLGPEALKLVSQSGLTMAEGIRAVGGDPDKLPTAAVKKGDLKAFLELHIEQGGNLDREKIQIGIVEGIVGIEHWNVVVEGFANHAGTTPMNMRQDALLAAAKFVIAVNDVINSHPGKQVGTVGKLAVAPGEFNVIPGKVTAGLEIRDLNYDKIWQLFQEVEKKADSIGKASNTRFSFAYQNNPARPAPTDKSIQDKILASATALGFSHKYLPSGAGHDSQELALVVPIGMIFVPSVGGISHSPKEFTKPVDMANGANVLLGTILKLDKE